MLASPWIDPKFFNLGPHFCNQDRSCCYMFIIRDAGPALPHTSIKRYSGCRRAYVDQWCSLVPQSASGYLDLALPLRLAEPSTSLATMKVKNVATLPIQLFEAPLLWQITEAASCGLYPGFGGVSSISRLVPSTPLRHPWRRRHVRPCGRHRPAITPIRSCLEALK